MESQLHVVASIGFNSSRQNCMTVHHTDLHFMWAVGCLLVVKSIGEDQNTYLKGHEGKITTIVCSNKGDLVATGETLSGLAACIVWNLKSKSMLFRVKVHKQHVQSLSFNCNESLLVSVGGAEDRSQLVCWNLTKGRSQSTQPNELTNYEVTDVKFYNHDPNKFITGHNNGVRFQMVDEEGKMQSYECQLGNLQRVFVTCLQIDKEDKLLYCGTRAGEVLEIILGTGRFARNGPVGKIFKGGVSSLSCSFSSIFVGCSNGHLAKVDKKTLLFQEEVQLMGGPICSVASSSETLYCLTTRGTLYRLQGERSHVNNTAQFMTSLNTAIVKVLFPQNYSNVFACLSQNEIRIFNTNSQTELLQIKLQSDESSWTANCLEFMADGKSIVTGWTDGKVRAFTPQSGKLLYVIDQVSQVKPTKSNSLPPAQEFQKVPSGVICICTNQYSDLILSGGYDTLVRLWQVSRQTQVDVTLDRNMHKAPVTSVSFIQNDLKAVSASIDGLIVIWDMTSNKLKKALTPLFQMQTPIQQIKKLGVELGISCLEYNKVTNELLTIGTDKRLTYFSIRDQKVITSMLADTEAELTAIAISPDGQLIVTGNEMGEMKLFTYQDSRLIHFETVHAAGIRAVAISPDNTCVITADQAGQVFLWRV